MNTKDLSLLVKLKKLYIRDIKLCNLDDIVNLVNLKTLSCRNCELINIKGISKLVNLRVFSCMGNKLSNLEEISSLNNLYHFDCSDNMLVDIEEVSDLVNLTYINCQNNRLKNLNPLINLCRLIYLNCDRNPFEEPHHPAIMRFFRRPQMNHNIYSNSQNVHDNNISISVIKSIQNLMKSNSKELHDKDTIIRDLLSKIDNKTVDILLNYFDIEDVHSYYSMKYFEVFQLVFAEMVKLNNDDLYIRLEEEIKIPIVNVSLKE